MSVVRWLQPISSQPLTPLICAFGGYPDAGAAATGALTHLTRVWRSRLVAIIEAEEFFCFTDLRPAEQCDRPAESSVQWPETKIWEVTSPLGTSALIAIGVEPNLRWRAFASAICDVALRGGDANEATPIYALSAVAASVAHTRHAAVYAKSDNPDLLESLAAQPMALAEHADISAAIAEECARREVPAVRLATAVPSYVPTVWCPPAVLALLERLSTILGEPIDIDGLLTGAADYVDEVDELVADDVETQQFVRRLETHADEVAAVGHPDFITAIEDFLRES